MEQVTPHLLFWINMKDCCRKKKTGEPEGRHIRDRAADFVRTARGHWKIIWESRLRYYNDGFEVRHLEVVANVKIWITNLWCCGWGWNPRPGGTDPPVGVGLTFVLEKQKKKKSVIKSVVAAKRGARVASTILSYNLQCLFERPTVVAVTRKKIIKLRVSVINVLHCGEFCVLCGAYLKEKKFGWDAATKFSVYEWLLLASVA